MSRLRQPQDMTLEEWQIALRRDFGRKQPFTLVKLERGERDHPILGAYRVGNPARGSSYRVVVRSERLGENSCTCPDFATNELGTCKHIEFALGKLAARRGGRRALADAPRTVHSEIVLRYGAERAVLLLPGTECPAEVSSIATRWFDEQGVLKPEAFDTLDAFLAESRRLGHEIRCDDDALDFIAEVRDAGQREQRIAEAFPRGIRDGAWRRLLHAKLHPYQREGALFAARAGRSIIGDEMGLGKTVQAIAAAEIMARHLGVERVLVVCPTSLKHQWANEIERFSGRPATVIGGMRDRRREAFGTESFFKIAAYEIVHSDLDLIEHWSPDLVIVDEAQRIKNWQTRVARSVKRLSSPYAIVLTGTPLENRLEELVSIVEFVDLHRLGPTFRLLRRHQVRDDGGRVTGYRDLDEIGRTLAPILIRRRKTEVLAELPPRLEKRYFVAMTPAQRALHTEHAELVATVVSKWRRTGFLTESDRRRLFAGLQGMRMSCDSSYLLDPETEHGSKPDEIVDLVADMLEEPGAKAVIFSQWLRMHELLARRLEARGIGHVLFHGEVPGDQRGELVRRFREDESCKVFLSTDAGGVGLNLQSASIVIHADLPWNPAVVEQRIGRAHRMGQTRPVQVVSFIAQGSIEHGMLEVLRFKKSLFAGALDGGPSTISLEGGGMRRFMNAVESATAAIPTAEVETPASVESAEDGPHDRDTRPVSSDVRPTGSRAGAAEGTGSGRTTHGGAATERSSASRDSSESSASTSLTRDVDSAPRLQPTQGVTATSFVELGISILEQFVGALAAPRNGSSASARRSSPASARPAPDLASLVGEDPASGERFLRLPLPEGDGARRLAETVASLAELLRGAGQRG